MAGNMFCLYKIVKKNEYIVLCNARYLNNAYICFRK